MPSACALSLPTNSVRIFQVGLNLGLWDKSETILHREECKGEEARGSSFRSWLLGLIVKTANEVFKYKGMQVDIQDGSKNT